MQQQEQQKVLQDTVGRTNAGSYTVSVQKVPYNTDFHYIVSCISEHSFLATTFKCCEMTERNW